MPGSLVGEWIFADLARAPMLLLAPLWTDDLPQPPVVASMGMTSGSWAGSLLAPVAFFIGWAAIGLVVAGLLAWRGHDMRLLAPVAIGLGPIMIGLALDELDRDEEAQPLELDPGTVGEGAIDVLVLIQERPDEIVRIVADLHRLEGEIRTLTFGRAVPYEWVDEGVDAHELVAVRRDLERARRLAQQPGAALVAFPGRVDAASRSFRSASASPLVLRPRDD